MSKKVLGIVGSPRKNGNTDQLIDVILESAKKAGAEVEKVYLSDLEIAHCRECLLCHVVKPKTCAIKDDMGSLVDKMNKADALVMGTPMFWYSPSGLFKDFMDRWYGYPINWAAKKNVFVIALGTQDSEVARNMRGMFIDSLGYEGAKPYAFVEADGAYEPGDVLKLDKVLAQARKVGAECAE